MYNIMSGLIDGAIKLAIPVLVVSAIVGAMKRQKRENAQSEAIIAARARDEARANGGTP